MNTVGTNNIIIGLYAGISLTTGSFNIIIGDYLDVNSTSQNFLLLLKMEDGDVIDRIMTEDEWRKYYYKFQADGLKAMIELMGYTLGEGYKNIVVNKN